MIGRLTPFFLPLIVALGQEDVLESIEVQGIARPANSAEIIVFDRQDIDASSSFHLDDLLRSHPNFSTYRRSGSGIAHPTSQGVSLRGAGTSAASRSFVLLDGIPLNDPFGGWVRWNRFSLAELETVRFGRKGAFVSSAGNIKLQSRRPVKSSQGQFGFAAGDVRGFSVDGFSASPANQKNWEATASFRIEDFAGHPVVRATQRGPIDEDAWSRMQSGRTTVSHQLSSGRLIATFAGFSEKRGNGTPLGRNKADGFDWTLGLQGEVSRTMLFGQERDFASVFPTVTGVKAERASESIVLDQFAVPASSLGFVHEHSFDADEHEFGFSIMALQKEGHTNEINKFTDTRRHAGGRQTQIGLSLADGWSPAESWNLFAELKGEWFRNEDGIRRGWKTSNGSFSVREDLEVGGSLDLSKALSETIVARSSVRSHVRQPTLNELYRPYRVGDFSVAANEDLEIERITGVEIGLDWQVTDRLSASLGLFHDQLHDSVANISELSNPNDATRRNLDKATVDGLQMSVEHLLTEELSFRLHGLLMDTEVRSCPENPGLVGNHFAQVPKQRATATLLWSPSQWNLRLDARHESERFDDARNSRLLDNCLTLDVSLSRRFSKNTRIFLTVNNITNEEIQTHRTAEGVAYVEAPRHWSAGLDWKF
ncbi:MAG: TonB-dependent receptor [Verrucomicrobia bacterium]|nr:TonB-dependent receptor [Verrucomicrobiota bacterium]